MDIRDILLFILVIAFMYNTYKLNKLEETEKFTTATTEQQITTAVKKIYLADVEAIRLLSNFAIQLSQGGTTVPGNVTFSGNVTTKGKMDVNGNLTISGVVATNNKDPTDLPAGWGGGLRTFDVYSDGTIATGTNKAIKASMNNVGEIYAEKSIKIGSRKMEEKSGSLKIDGNLTVDGQITLPDRHILRSAGRQHIAGDELLYLLNKDGVIIGKEWGGNGNLQVQGSVKIGSWTIQEVNGDLHFNTDPDPMDPKKKLTFYFSKPTNKICRGVGTDAATCIAG